MALLDWVRQKLGIRSPSIEIKKGLDSIDLQAAFERGLEEGKKNPLFWFDEEGNFHTREYTPEELETLALCRAIVERAFPGIYDEED